MGPPHVDEDSVDLTLGGTRGHGTTRKSPRLEIQAKCTETDDGSGPHLAFRLPYKNYEDLRDTDVHVPHILVVLCVPRDLTEWLRETEAETALRRVAYWLSLRGSPAMPETSSSDSKRTVRLPRAQRFTADALRSIMTRIGEGGVP